MEINREAKFRLASAARRFSAILGASVVLGLAGCGDSVPDPAADDRVFRTAEDFRAGYWIRPVPPQGAAAAAGSGLRPATCGSCHVPQYEDWKTTIHAHAYSPGLEGQLVWWETSNYGMVRQCLACHAPLSEQSARIPEAETGVLAENPGYDPALQREGVVCAACHIRGGQGHGPPLRDGRAPPPADDAPHGGVIRTEYFTSAEFCAGCHQFEQPAANGKSLQNTHEEWKASRYPDQGMTCQTCHMPNRRHLWRGIQDSTMTRNGVTIELLREGPREVALRVTNTGTGHRFPTYVTPKIVVQIEQFDEAGHPIEAGSVEGEIGREVQSTATGWVEHSDTRIPPDSSFVLRGELMPDARAVRGLVTVFPDGFYDNMFASLLAGSLSDTSRALLTRAKQETASSSYRIFDEQLRLRSGR